MNSVTDKSTSTHALAHDDFFNELRAKEYKRLETEGHIYLDYTGGNLYPESLINQHMEVLKTNVFGNPHSTNPTSQLATKLVEEARAKVIEFFNAEDYYCVFTPNASGALKIVGECYPFDKSGFFLLTTDNHNSVNGIREYCRNRGGEFNYVGLQPLGLNLDKENLDTELSSHKDKENRLFAFPAQSNVSGVKHDLSLIKQAQDEGWDVLLDAAAFVPTSRLDLKAVQPDFVAVSFYKIFGYPTGLGCLLVKKSKMNVLEKKWFAGGNVTMSAVKSPGHFLHPDHQRFENGTINYLDIPALKNGLDFIDSIGVERISERVVSLTEYLYNGLRELKHDTGVDQVALFGPEDRKKSGGTVIMSFMDDKGAQLSNDLVEFKANAEKISIRSGCFCNPGIDEINNDVAEESLENYFSEKDHGDYCDFVSYIGKMRGAIRVSVGLATTKADCDTFIKFVKSLRG